MSAKPKAIPPVSKLQLVIGVAGHMDLRQQDRERLKGCVRGIFADLEKHYPKTPLVLLSALGEGADRLVAEIATDCGVNLIVPLAREKAKLEEELTDPASLKEFRTLLGKARQTFDKVAYEAAGEEAPGEEAGPRPNQAVDPHTMVSAYIVRHSQILIALWDGVMSSTGHTATVVSFKLNGVPEPYGPPRNPLDPVETGQVFHIVTPTASNPHPAGAPFSLQVLSPKGPEGEAANVEVFGRIYSQMDAFNNNAVRLASQLAAVQEKSKRHVLAPDVAEAQSQAVQTSLNRYGWADALAQHYQGLTFWALRGVLLLAFAAACCLQLSSRLGFANPLFLVCHLAFLSAAYAWYFWARRGGYQLKYIDYRALAEGLRVYLFWRMAGLRHSPADYYLRQQRDDLDWIRQALRAWSIPDSSGLFTPHPVNQLKQAHTSWVDNQLGFFRSRVRKYRWRTWLIGKVVSVFLLLGLGLGFCKLIAEEFVPLLPKTWLGSSEPAWRNSPWLLAVNLSLVLAILLHYYGKTMGFAEHVKRFQRMAMLFGNADVALRTELDAKEVKQAQQVLLDLGKEALTENGDWVLLHRERPVIVPRV